MGKKGEDVQILQTVEKFHVKFDNTQILQTVEKFHVKLDNTLSSLVHTGILREYSPLSSFDVSNEQRIQQHANEQTQIRKFQKFAKAG